jgi:hypothetical protein
LRRPERRHHLEERARRFAASEHSPAAMARDYLDCLREAAEIPAPAPELPSHLQAP